ncbi:MAG: hypothetical protein AABY09_00720, partial [Nanoarchaeota archaeon]
SDNASVACGTTNDCKSGQSCTKGVCVQVPGQCIESYRGNTPTLDIHIFGYGLTEEELDKYARQVFSQMLNVEPFGKYVDVYHVKYNVMSGIAPTSSNFQMQKLDKFNCFGDQADIVAIVDNRAFRSYASFTGTMYLSYKAINLEYLFLHEFGHAFGKLGDEYTEPGPVSASDKFKGFTQRIFNAPKGINCGPPREKKSQWSKMGFTTLADSAQANGWYGCGGQYCKTGICKSYIRPSYNSIMRDYFKADGKYFNAVSEYVLNKKLRQFVKG